MEIEYRNRRVKYILNSNFTEEDYPGYYTAYFTFKGKNVVDKMIKFMEQFNLDYSAMVDFLEDYEKEEMTNYPDNKSEFNVTIMNADIFICFVKALEDLSTTIKIDCIFDGLLFWLAHDIYHSYTDVHYGEVITNPLSESQAHKKAIFTVNYFHYKKYPNIVNNFIPDNEYLMNLINIFNERFGYQYEEELRSIFKLKTYAY